MSPKKENVKIQMINANTKYQKINQSTGLAIARQRAQTVFFHRLYLEQMIMLSDLYLKRISTI